MQRLYFVRHGLSVLNAAGKYAGMSDTPLTDKGRIQSRAAGKKATTLEIDYIISSPLSRTIETAQIIAQELSYPVDAIEVNALFTERNFGSLEGTEWSPDIDLSQYSDVESLETILARSKRALEYLNTIKANILVVSHGAFGRALRHHLIPDKPYTYPERFTNAQVVQLL